MRRVAVLDDYSHIGSTITDWTILPNDIDVTFFTDHVSSTRSLVERLRDFDVIMAMRERTLFPRKIIEQLPKLRLLTTTGMRNAAIDLEAAKDCNVVVCGTDGLLYPTAELTWGLILALARHIPREDTQTRLGKWQVTLGSGLNGMTLGLLGLGRLGAQVARIGQAFQMKVLAWSPNLTAMRASACETEIVTKAALFSKSDVLSIHLVLGNRSRGLVGAQELKTMKPTAYLINTSRGPIIDEAALIQALDNGWIAGAGLDVFDEEPLPLSHPLRNKPNTVITPHMGYVTRETLQIFFDQTIENILAFFDNAPIRTLQPT